MALISLTLVTPASTLQPANYLYLCLYSPYELAARRQGITMMDHASQAVKPNQRHLCARAILWLCCTLFLSACQDSQPLSLLEKIQHSGELVVATQTGPTTFYKSLDQFTGFEYELAQQFADFLGVKLRLVTFSNVGELLSAVESEKVHFAAAGITITPERAQNFRFSTSYQEASQTLVYKKKNGHPKNLDGLKGGKLIVLANSSHAESLARLKENHQNIQWEELEDGTVLDMLNMINDGKAQYTVLDSNLFDIHRDLFPELRSAFNVKDWEPLAWAFPPTQDMSLYLTAEQFFNKVEADGALEEQLERFYGHRSFDYVGARTFIKHRDTRLPSYEKDFKDAAKDLNVDWRLLAAIGYQESLWNPNAISPTGVRGLMMLTHKTAGEMGVKNRRDAQESISGGSHYFKKLYKRLPASIQEPHRTWFALAAYNTGYGHLQDARHLAKLQTLDPDNWFDVKKMLPLLKKPEYYTKTKYGYARGGAQSVVYVENIRRYYDTLVWANERDLIDSGLPSQHALAMNEYPINLKQTEKTTLQNL